MIIIANRRCKEHLYDMNPDATIIDVTSKSNDEFIRLSPFYPHRGIPVPFSPNWEASCVEAVWQGLKVFKKEDIDTALFQNKTMRNLKRNSNKRNNYKRGQILGHRKGVNGRKDALLGLIDARLHIYAPTYRWVLENRTMDLVERIRELSFNGTVILLDYTTNADIYNISSALSHAGLIKAYIEGNYPEAAQFEERVVPDEVLSQFYNGRWVTHEDLGIGVVKNREGAKVTVVFKNAEKVIHLGSGTLAPFDTSGQFSFPYESLVFRKRPDAEELEVVSCSLKNAEQILIPDNISINNRNYPVCSIGKRAFAEMPNLGVVIIPPRVTEIAADAFEGCERLCRSRKVMSGKENATLISNYKGLWGVKANPVKKVEAVPCEYEEIRFHAGKIVRKQIIPTYYFLVKKNGKWGLLNKMGRQQAPCIYDELQPMMSAGLLKGFTFRRGEITGIINGIGEETIG